MQKENSKRKSILSALFFQYRTLGKRWLSWFHNLNKPNPEVETSSRRYDIRGSIDSFTERVWDAIKKPRRMDELLRKQSTRAEKNEGVQRKQEEVDRRNSRLSRLSKTEGWEVDVVGMLRQWVNFCYMNLRFPEARKDKVSLDYYVGFQNGALWVIEGLRKDVYGAVIGLKRSHALKVENGKNKYANKTQ